MKQTKQIILLMSAISLLSLTKLSAQVSIGSNNAPILGALLQLKENDGANDNSNRGLSMPRVKLTSLTATSNNLATTVDGASLIPVWNTDQHTGLIVYHTDHCSLKGSGLYVWSGTEWQKLGKTLLGGLNLSATTLDFPSGQDFRTLTPKTFDVSWLPNGEGIAAPTYNSTASEFTTISPANGLLSTTSPQTMTVQPAAMTVPYITENPFATLTKTITFNSGAPCNKTQPIIITQTNYAIQSFNDAMGATGATNTLTTPSNFIRLTDTSQKTFRIKSNAAWKTTIANPNNILTHTIPATGGADTPNNTIPPDNDYTLTGIIGTGTKNQTATITIEDSNNPKRAKDVTVTCYSCLGTDGSLIGLPTATSAQTSGENIWGTKVILHQAKTGVYEQFISADFGDAGRWMTTNLSATAYDIGVTHSQSRTLQIMPNSYTSNLYNVAYWGYPNTDLGKPQQSTEYNKNTSLGLLYTWDAATAGKGGLTGLLNIYNPAGNNAGSNEVALPESLNMEAGKQKRIQGICPAGWHLPSDYEWVELEREIIRSTTNYANVSSNIDNGNGEELAKVPQKTASGGGWRGTAHGTAMKDICETSPSYDPAGASKPASQGGFSVSLAGSASAGRSSHFGKTAFFWSSSSNVNNINNDAWYIVLDYVQRGVIETISNRYNLYSVRCKKD